MVALSGGHHTTSSTPRDFQRTGFENGILEISNLLHRRFRQLFRLAETCLLDVQLPQLTQEVEGVPSVTDLLRQLIGASQRLFFIRGPKPLLISNARSAICNSNS